MPELPSWTMAAGLLLGVRVEVRDHGSGVTVIAASGSVRDDDVLNDGFVVRDVIAAVCRRADLCGDGRRDDSGSAAGTCYGIQVRASDAL
jgi:hypothetical protein